MSSSQSLNGKCRQISLDEIKDATNNFHEDNVLGQGGEGKVYLAKIQFGWKITQVAVKHLKPNSQEFEKEIKTISNIQHPNLVSLLGYCDESGQKILLYEYMEKGSLADYVKKKSSNSLSWLQRIRICLDAARGLQYLHVATDENPKGIIHRDVKPDNILLGKDWVAKISDFGMFKLSHAGQVQSTMFTGLKGTGGYYAPEYLGHRSVTRKIDVYAFGVVLFQVLCHKMPWDRGDESYYWKEDEDLGAWAYQNVDPSIKPEISNDSLKEFSAIIGTSLKGDPRKRPSMDGVVLGLEKVLKSLEREDEAKKGGAAKESSSEHSTAGSRRGATSVVSETIAEDDTAIVLDIGGGITKAGFAGEDRPRVVFASGIGRLKNNGGSSRMYIGKDLASYEGEVTLRNPVKDGIVVSWAEYEKVLHHMLYNELHYDPENKRPVLLTEPPLRHNATDGEKKEYRTNRENMIDVMFDKFDVPALYIGIQPVLSLFASYKTTGLVIESGEGMSHSVPIYEGHVLPHAITSLKLAGRGITDHLLNTLNEERDYSFSSRADRDIVKDMKEKMAYIALNYKAELRKSNKMNKSYTLPDGKLISVGQELFQCPEALFDPSIVGIDEPGIHENTYDSLILCNEEIRDDISRSIVLGGGSTMLTGFNERLEKEIRGLASSGTEIKIVADPVRNYSAWIGGSIVASLASFQKMWITRKEYEDYGTSILHKKCF